MRVRVALAALTLVSALLVAEPARACAACACGTAAPTGAGVDVPFAGRLRTGLLWDSTSVSDAHNVVVATQARLALWWAPVRDTVLDVAVPFGARVRFDEDTGDENGRAAHVGDAAIGARLVLWRDRMFSPWHVVSLRLGATLPTGPEIVSTPRAPKGAPARALAPELQTGRGAVLPRIDALWLAIPSARTQLIVQAGAEAPMIALRDLAPAPSADASAVAQWLPREGVGVRLGANARVVGAETRDGRSAPAGQRAGVNAVAGVLLQPDPDLLLVLDVAVPLAQQRPEGGVARDRMSTSLSVVWDVPTPKLR